MKDPTKTIVLRNKAARQIDVRFNRIKRAVRSAFTKGKLLTNISLARDGEFEFTRDGDKVAEFQAFLQKQIDDEILRIETLTVTQRDLENHWLNRSVGEGYRRGAVKSRLAVERGLPNIAKLPSYNPFANPAHVERAELIFQRVYEDLEGVTQVMSKQMSRILSEGIVRGDNPKEVAEAMLDRVDKIGKTRAKLIARTEIIESHNIASIKEAELLESETGVEIKMEWVTALDGRQRHSHEARNGNIYTKEEVQKLIGEPNCRCNVTPYIQVD